MVNKYVSRTRALYSLHYPKIALRSSIVKVLIKVVYNVILSHKIIFGGDVCEQLTKKFNSNHNVT